MAEILSTVPDIINGEEFGQSEPLTTRLHNLIRNYPSGPGIFKEFLQNADDAKASHIDIILDCRTHPSAKLPATSMAALQGPAVVVYNDAPFTPQDLRDIQRIGRSGKSQTGSKTGRFGLGFNAAYNITDLPYFLTGETLAFFDPHTTVIPKATDHKPGRLWHLAEAWDHFPDLLLPFEAIGLSPGSRTFPNTAFRLPLRTAVQAASSEICRLPYTETDFREVLGQLKTMAADMLIFLKHVTSLAVSEIRPDGNRILHLDVKTVNALEVRENRAAITSFVPDNHEAMLAALANTKAVPPHVSYRHVISVKCGLTCETQTWRVVSGIYRDNAGSVVNAVREMHDHGEKAIPWAGAATRIDQQNGAEAVTGQIYCFLPIPQKTGLPAHINGYFDLEDSRQSLFLDDSARGKDACRVRWNRVLLENVIPHAYAEMVEALTADISRETPEVFYSKWPTCPDNTSSWLTGFGSATYHQLASRKTIRTISNSMWLAIGNTIVIPESWEELQPILEAESLSVPTPPLPLHVRKGFITAGVGVTILQPETMRSALRTDRDLNVELEKAPRPGLRRREWIEALLRFCLSDKPGNKLRGVPLAMTSDAKLRTFGLANAGKLFLAGPEERGLFAGFPEVFIDENFATNTRLTEVPTAGVLPMSIDDAVPLLKKVIQGANGTKSASWIPDSTNLPNERWLQAVYQYLTPRRLQTAVDALKTVLLVPDQHRKLHCMGTASTPLHFTIQNLSLRRAVEEFGIPLVTGNPALLDAITKFMNANQNNLIWPLTPKDLIDSLAAVAQSWPARQTMPATPAHALIIDYLSSDECTCRLKADAGVRINKLRTLPFFPLTDGTVIRLDSGPAYIPEDFKFPAIPMGIRLLQTGPQNNWRTLLSLIGAKTLDRGTFIEVAILPDYGGMTPGEQVKALEWLRDNMDTAQTELETQAPVRAAALTRAIREAPLLRCSDGELHAPTNVYMPDAEIVRMVLGDAALFPDMIGTYINAQPHWIQFFRKLEMPASPRIIDLKAYIDARADAYEKSGQSTASEQLVTILNYIEKHWDELAGGDAAHPGAEFIQFVEYLRTKNWLPALREHHRTKYPAFKSPAARLYSPAELHMPRNGQLVASQCPIATFPEPEARVRNALGFPVDPPCVVVTAHFDALRQFLRETISDPSKQKGFETALGVIYTYFGRMLPKEGSEQPTSENTDDPPPLSGDLETLRKTYAGVECLWDFETLRFWPPEHVFTVNVRYMGEWRKCIQVKNPAADRGYSALGRNQDPSTEDHIELLDFLASKFKDSPLTWEAAQNVIQIITRLGHQLDESQKEADDIFLLSYDNRLVHASVIYIADAPWIEGRYDRKKIAILSNSITGHILKAAQVKRLSNCVHEQLAAPPTASTDSDLLERCKTWEQRLRTQEFALAVQRLVQHEEGFLESNALTWLSDISIVPASDLKADLYIDTDEDPQHVGSGIVDYFSDIDGNTIYLNADNSLFMQQNLTVALNQMLKRAHLRDLLPLSTLLENLPSNMNQVLDALRIRTAMPPGHEENPGIPLPIDSPLGDFPEDDLESSNDNLSPQIGKKHETNSFVKVPEGIQVEEMGARLDSSENKGHDALGVTPDHDKPAINLLETAVVRGSPSETSSSGGPVSRGDDGQERGNNGTRIPVAPRTEPKDTRSRPQGHYTPQHQLISYVDHDKNGEEHDEANLDTESASQKRLTGKHAEKAVMQYEAEKRGWTPELMPPGNKGFDIRSVGPDGSIRYIEVKGIDGPWGERGVSLSPPQFNFVIENPDKDFWVYVVEFAREPERLQIHPIQNPAARVNHYFFDHGWKHVAETTKQSLITPLHGMMLNEDGKLIGEIVYVTDYGTFKKLTVKCEGEGIVIKIYKPSTMTVSAREGG